MNNVRFTVAECNEFPSMGAIYHADTVDEAIALYRNACIEKPSLIPGLFICVKGEDGELVEMPLITGKTIDLEFLYCYPDVEKNEEAMTMIEEIIAKLPNMEVRGKEEILR